MAVTLKCITEDNFLEAFRLKLRKDQEEFVSHPIRSLAQAYVYRNQCQPFGIYQDEEMVGYVMVIYDYDLQEYNIWHMMIDCKFQGRGYGKLAMEQCLAYIRTQPFGNSNRVVLTCNRDNESALRLYRRFGFTETGNSDEDELEFALTLEN